ncbi:MAG TPA: M14 family metallopeptidase [Vicinamibacterales bacterium]
MKHCLALVTLFTALSGAASAQTAPDPLQTRPERTGFTETSSYDDVVAFMQVVAKKAPKLIHLSEFGKTFEGRSMPIAIVGAADATPAAVKHTNKLRVHIQGNIHAGEVEGKESAQILLREFAEGKHADWLKTMVFIVEPIYNADGNEKMALNNRGRQNGPVAGQGQRPNAQGFDLNRDHMKLESPEARAFVTLMNDYDPHVSMDLHTTNGSRHAYYLTYAPPLNPATDPAIVELLRKDWLPAVTKVVKSKYDWDFYYYGNFEQGDRNERAWKSFDSRPRFNNNYIGLRNRVAILSEAYAYATFEDRIKATSRFIEEVLNYAGAHADAIRKLTESSDKKKIVGTQLALRAKMVAGPEPVEILVGEVTEEKNPRDGHVMSRRADVRKPEMMPEYGTFAATETERVPATYYVPAALTKAVELLKTHGVRMTELKKPTTVQVEEFQIAESQAGRAFQGHAERTLTGKWVPAERTVPAGSFAVELSQPLGRLAFYLLEPRSDDGLANWNVLDEAIGDSKVYPIVRSRN